MQTQNDVDVGCEFVNTFEVEFLIDRKKQVEVIEGATKMRTSELDNLLLHNMKLALTQFIMPKNSMVCRYKRSYKLDHNKVRSTLSVRGLEE